MGVYVDNVPNTNNSSLLYDTGPSGNFTFAYWFRMNTDRNTYSCVGWLGHDTATFAAYIGTSTDGTTSQIWQHSVQRGSNGTAYTVGEWHHYALVSNTAGSSSFTFYRDGVSDINSSWSSMGLTTGSGARVWLGMDPLSPPAEAADGDYGDVMVWTTQLTQAEVLQQMRMHRPCVQVGSLWMWCPLLHGANGTDFSGNGRNLTLNGTVIAANGPPIPWGGKVRYFFPAAVAGAPAPNVTDAMTVGESVTASIPLLGGVSITDAVTVGESVTLNTLLMPNVADAVTAGESVVLNVLLMPDVADAVTVGESITVAIPLLGLISVSDAVTVGELATVDISTDVPEINVTDAVTVGELATLSILLMPDVADAVTIGEAATLNALLMPNITDAVTVGETVALNALLMPNVTDAVTVDEITVVSIVGLPLEINVTDAVTVGEAVTVSVGIRGRRGSLLTLMVGR